MKKKKCSKCKQKKPATEFHKNKRNKDRLQTYCKDCNKQYRKKYYQTPKGKESHRKAVKKYQQTPKYKEVQKKYRQTHKEEQKKYMKKYWMQHILSRARNRAKDRGLGFNIIAPPDDFYNEEFFQDELVIHHINDIDVVLIPKRLHQKFTQQDTWKHRNNLLPIIKEHYRKSNHAIVNKSEYII